LGIVNESQLLRLGIRPYTAGTSLFQALSLVASPNSIGDIPRLSEVTALNGCWASLGFDRRIGLGLADRDFG
jgi:hypothetical protein